MFHTATVPLTGWRTNPLVESILIEEDLTGASFRLEVRDRAEGGALRAALNTSFEPSAQGVMLMDVGQVGTVIASLLRVTISEATMRNMPLGPEPGSEVELRWGMHITPASGPKFMAFDGPFIIKASVPA